jgi:hypothetical protein
MQTDFIALATAYATGVVLLLLGYVLAGPVWVERHSIQLTGPGRSRRVSGFWGEFFLFTACALVFVVVRFFTQTSILADVILPHRLIAAGVFGAVVLMVWAYSVSVVAGAGRDGKDAAYRGRLAAAYTPYAVYSAILFAGGILVIALLAFEFAHDQVGFNTQAQVITAAVDQAARAAHASGDPAAAARQALTYLEDAVGDLAVSQDLLQEQMNPVFVFAAAIFLVNILIVLSPIRSAFMQGAIDLTHILTGIAIGGIVIEGFVSYFLSYSQVIQHMLASMAPARPPAALGAWELSQRYNEMVVQLNHSKNLLGFVQAIGGEGSGLALFAAGIQFTVERIPKRGQH